MQGSDIIVDVPSRNIHNAVVDEKAQSQYINHPLPTFAFELSFIASYDNLVEGWFTDESKKTEYYLCIWISEASKSWSISAGDIRRLDYALVSRQRILDFLAAHGYDNSGLRAKASEIRRGGINGPHEKLPNCDFYFFYSAQLAEKPVNVIMKKNALLRLADLKGEIIA